jgi:hypothetical protein
MVQAQTVAMERGENVREAIIERAKAAAERERFGEVGENNVDWDLLVSC